MKFNKYHIQFIYYLVILIVTIIGYFSLGYIGRSVIETEEKNLTQEAIITTEQIKEVLEQKFDRKLALAKTLAAFVKYNPNLSQIEFDDFAKYLYESSKNDLISIQLVMDSIITYNYPISGNEKTIGVNIFDVSGDRNVVNKAFKNKEVMSVGPRTLIQNKLGVVYREPIVLDDESKTLFGYAVMVLDLEQMFSKIPIIINNKNNLALFSEKSGLDSSGFFYGNSTIQKDLAILKESIVPLDKWSIYYNIPTTNNGIFSNLGSIAFIFFLALIIGILAGVSVKSILVILEKNHLLLSKNKYINQQLEEKQILIGEIHHRIKNHFQMLSSLNRILYLDVEDEKIQEIINDINNRVNSMASIYDQLRDSDSTNLSLKDYIKSLSENLVNTLNTDIKVEIEIEDQPLDIKRTINLGVILTEIITNSLKHAFINSIEGRIKISIQTNGDNFILRALDNGNLLKSEVLVQEHQSQGIELIKLISAQINAELTYFSDTNWNGFQLKFKA